MATYNKFENFVQALAEKEHNLSADALHWYLSNATPSASGDSVKTDLAEITAENGYSAGGPDSQNTGAETGGTYTLTATAATITAESGTVGPFRYVVGYNNTHASDGLISWWDYGSALTLQDGESFTIKPNNSATTGTWLTLA
jgi:hypothetical protein